MMSPQKSLFSASPFLLSRREALRVGAVSLFLPSLITSPRASAAPLAFPSVKTVIFLWMSGGLSHVDTFDPKPGADRTIRGPFDAIRTNADGLQISDRLPRLARHAASYAILRGVSHGEGGHERAAHLVLTGHSPASTQIFPNFGAVLSQADASISLLSSSRPKQTAAERKSEENYGDTAFGRACLTARREAEQGVPFIQVPLMGWDLHSDHFSRLQNDLLPALDAGVSAMLGDLEARGLLESTLVVCMGEFGRSPRTNGNRLPGRDHWPAAASVLLAGGGIRGGQVFGATDGDGMAPLEFAIHPQDILATIYHLAGISALPAFSEPGRVLREICR